MDSEQMLAVICGDNPPPIESWDWRCWMRLQRDYEALLARVEKAEREATQYSEQIIDATRDLAIAWRERDEARAAIAKCVLVDPPGDCYAAEVVDLRARIEEFEVERERLKRELAVARGDRDQWRESWIDELNLSRSAEIDRDEARARLTCIADAIRQHKDDDLVRVEIGYWLSADSAIIEQARKEIEAARERGGEGE